MPQYYDDEVEEYDDYEDEGEEEEYEEVEERKPTAEELEYLNYRERMKERIRRKMLKENGSSAGRSLYNRKKLPLESFGSFFGPSQPVIAQRVIQESKSLLENPHLSRRVENPQRTEKRSSSTASAPKNGVTERVSTVKKELQTKVQTLKNTRDYSFLLSDDADVPAPAKVPPARRVSVPQSEARPAQVQQKSKQPMATGYNRHVNGGAPEQRKSNSMNGQPPLRTMAPHKGPSSSGTKPSIDSRRQPGSSNGVGPGRPAVPKGLPPKPALGHHSDRRAPLAAPKTQRPLPSKMPSSSQRPQLEQRKMMQEPSRYLEQRKLVYEPNRQSDHRRIVQDPSRSRPMAKQPIPPPRPQINKPVRPPSSSYPLNKPGVRPGSSYSSVQESRTMKKPISRNADDGYNDRYSRPPVRRPESRPAPRDDRPKKRPSRPFPEDDDDEGAQALSIIRNMFNVKRYAGRDDDDSDMEANFDDILEEERRSALIARKEDEEQLRLIEEEERQERMRKKRKLNR